MRNSKGKFDPKRFPLMVAALIAFVFAFLSIDSLSAQQTRAVTGFDQLNYLVGEWVGEGGGSDPGQGSGGFSFSLDLQGKIMTRKNNASYPATKDRPAYSHDDLMVLYQGSPASPVRAIYFDNEGHVINYDVEISEDRDSIIFTSDPSASSPRFRLTYIKTGDDTMRIVFDMAPPGKLNAFAPYIEASARRR